MTTKIRIPRIAAMEMIDGIAARAEWDCGCVTIRLQGIGGRGIGHDTQGDPAMLATSVSHETAASKPAYAHPIWTYLERCDTHAAQRGARFGGHILMDPSDLTDPNVRKDWRA